MTESSPPNIIIKKNERRPSGTIPAVDADLRWIDRLHRLWAMPADARRSNLPLSA
jgi:hypothetical protein